MLKVAAEEISDIVLRLPGLLLLELWWRNKDVSFEEITQEMLSKAPFNSYFDISTILDFVHRRDFDQSAAIILSNSVLIISALLISLPLSKLFRMYACAMSVFVFAFAHYLSCIYVFLEQSSKEQEVHLDDFVKLERHGFHFLAQVFLAVFQAFILRIENDFGRVCLAMFTGPILARMCGIALDKLIYAHNISCSLAMLFMCVYILYLVPEMLQGLGSTLRSLKNIFVNQGLASGCAEIWRRLRLAELLTFAWLTLFGIRVYVEIFEKGRTWREAGPVLLAGIAESTNTPLSLLSLALTVGYLSKWIVDAAQLAVGGRRDHGHVLNNSGYAEAFVLVLLCAQTSLIGMKTEKKAFLMGLALFIVASALLHSLYQLLEPQMLVLAACPSSNRSRHLGCLILATFLLLAPIGMCYSILIFLPLDLWCIIICSHSVLVCLHSASAISQYFIGVVDSRSAEPWEQSDDLLFGVKAVTKCIELLVAMIVVGYGSFLVVQGDWTIVTLGIIIFHIVINICNKMDDLHTMVVSRRQATKNISQLAKANGTELKDRGDVCAICIMEMVEEARVTPCKHYFHGACLRKWLTVKQVCPLCYTEITADPPISSVEQEPVVTRDAEWREIHRMDGARDMWPLLRERDYESDDSSTTSSNGDSEYTLRSTDTDGDVAR
ncbi:unnamed protein product [Auanema sp. JU1783]|nr:unnamed protein product [Auanema sp. JU1783]